MLKFVAVLVCVFDDGFVGVCVLCLMYVLMVYVFDFGVVGLCFLRLLFVLLVCV